MNRRKILITGAAGNIGSYLWKALGGQYQMRLMDIGRNAAPHEYEFIQADISDIGQVRRACEGIDTVVHLAADSRPTAEFYESLLKSNVIGTYNVFQSAREQGCKRVVFASTVLAVGGYPKDQAVRWDMPLNPTSLYAVTKCYGEALGRYYANTGLSSICLRIGALMEPDKENPQKMVALPDEWEQGWISLRDLVLLIQRCIEVEDVPFAIVHGQSRHQNPRLDMTHTSQLLGYEPEDGTAK